MQINIARSLKAATIGLTFLFAAGTAQAMPVLDHDFGVLGVGTQSHSDFLPDGDPNVLWYGFTLSTNSLLDLTTIGSFEDTEIGLYTSIGTLLGQNDDCNNVDLYSCLQFPSLAAGDYIVGIADFEALFFDDFDLLSTGESDNEITLTVTARALNPVPVPAAVWLFGSALIGFIGMSRRTSIKA